jgi:hypothetical protein
LLLRVLLQFLLSKCRHEGKDLKILCMQPLLHLEPLALH